MAGTHVVLVWPPQRQLDPDDGHVQAVALHGPRAAPAARRQRAWQTAARVANGPVLPRSVRSSCASRRPPVGMLPPSTAQISSRRGSARHPSRARRETSSATRRAAPAARDPAIRAWCAEASPRLHVATRLLVLSAKFRPRAVSGRGGTRVVGGCSSGRPSAGSRREAASIIWGCGLSSRLIFAGNILVQRSGQACRECSLALSSTRTSLERSSCEPMESAWMRRYACLCQAVTTQSR